MQGILSAIFSLLFGTCVVFSQGVRWSHICARETKNLTCPLGSTFEMTGVLGAYRELGCPDNLTDPVAEVADCWQRYAGEDLFIDKWNGECNGATVCTVRAPSGNIIAGCIHMVAIFFAVSYKCHLHVVPTSPETSSPTTPTGNTNRTVSSNIPVAAPVTPTAAVAKSGSSDPLIIGLAAGIGGAVLIVIVILLVIFYKRRKSGDGDDRKLTASQIKEAGRPDVTMDTFAADGAYVNYNPSDPRRLYAVLDKCGQSEDMADVPMYIQLGNLPKTETKATTDETNIHDTAQAETADPHKTYQNTSFSSLTIKANSPKIYQNTGFN